MLGHKIGYSVLVGLILTSACALGRAGLDGANDETGGEGASTGESGGTGGRHVAGTGGHQSGRANSETGGSNAGAGRGGAPSAGGTSPSDGGEPDTNGGESGDAGASGAGGEGDDGDAGSDPGGAPAGGAGPASGGSGPGGGMAGSGMAGGGSGGSSGSSGECVGDFDLALESYPHVYAVENEDYLSFAITNLGPCPSVGPVTFTDELPSSFEVTSATSSQGWTCETTANRVTCTYPASIAPGQTVIDPYLWIRPHTFEESTFENRASISSVGDINAENDVRNDELTVQGPVDLALELDSSCTTSCLDPDCYDKLYACGYQATVENVGMNPTLALIRVDCGGRTGAGISPSGGWSCQARPDLGLLYCNTPRHLAPGEAIPLSFYVTSIYHAVDNYGCTVRILGETNGDNNSDHAPHY